MQQPCKKCGFESPETDKYCRQCGGQLSMESEFSSAATLNQGRVEPSPSITVAGTGKFPPSVSDVIGGETERYYNPPQYAPVAAAQDRPQYFTAPQSTSGSWFKSFFRFSKGAFSFLLIVALIVSTAMAVYFAHEADDQRRRTYELEDRARARAGRENANGRAQDAWDQMEEALLLTHEAAEKATAAGAELMVGDEKPIDLDKYAYPGAQVEAKSTKPGAETISMLTRQNSDAVQAHYERLFGKPVLQVAVNYGAGQRKKILFQSSSAPSILVKIEEVDLPDSEKSQVKITILHAFLRFPRFNEVQAQNLK
jgi:hypothetical protein